MVCQLLRYHLGMEVSRELTNFMTMILERMFGKLWLQTGSCTNHTGV